MTAVMTMGPPGDRDEVTPVVPMPGFLRRPPNANARRTRRDEMLNAALVEMRALRLSLLAMLRGASLFASVVVVLVGILALQARASSARATSTPLVVPATPAPATDQPLRPRRW
jgi:hypothetical protein